MLIHQKIGACAKADIRLRSAPGEILCFHHRASELQEDVPPQFMIHNQLALSQGVAIGAGCLRILDPAHSLVSRSDKIQLMT